MSEPDQTRRQFIRKASTGVGAAAVMTRFGKLVGDASAQVRTLNFALAGLGSLSTNQIAPALAKTQHARLAGVITGTPEKAARWQSEHGFPDGNVYSYDDMDGLAANPDIDVVYVVTPNSLHLEHTVRAARAGKHVLCEKPMANTVSECEQMIAACDDAGVKLAIAYRCQFEPHHVECIRMARENDFGSIRVIQAGFGFRIGNPQQWRLRAALAGGGALMDVGVYALQSCRYLTGEEPIRVSALETKTDPVKFAEVDESITWQMTFPSGVIADCSTTYNVNGINRFQALAERGWFGLEPAYDYGGIRGESSRGPIAFESIDQFAAEIDDFAQCILEDRESKVAGSEGLKDLRVIEAIYESIRSGRTIELPELA
jgi:predicted dehydrogenase